MFEGKRFFITGGAGFIGSKLVEQLLDKNQVIVYDTLRRDSLKDQEFRKHTNLTFIRGDILNYEYLSSAIQAADPTHVIHCAAIAGVDAVIKSVFSTIEVNMTGTANLLKATSHLRNVERVVCFSTSEVFGSQSFLSEEKDSAVIGTVGEARWTYAVSKLAGEHLALAYHKDRGLPVVVVRPFNIYGPNQGGDGALTTFVRRALKGEELQIHGDGTHIRAWCYIDDMVCAALIAL